MTPTLFALHSKIIPTNLLSMNTDPFIRADFADEELKPVIGAWLAEMVARPVSVRTVHTYESALLSFTKSLTLHDKPHTLSSVTEANVMAWKTDMREGRIVSKTKGHSSGPCAPSTIHSYIIILKVFSNRWLKRRYTNTDLLELVELGKLQVELKDALTLVERERVLSAVDGSSFEQVRDKAFVQLLLATACRFKEIHGLDITTVDVDNKRVWVVLKGGRSVPVDIDGKALRDFKIYLGRRRLVASSAERAVWLTDDGSALSYWGAYAIFDRLRARSGVKCNPHKFRHTVAQAAAANGAPVADIQDLLHHSSDHMSRRYIGNARQDVAAGLAKKWSLAG